MKILEYFTAENPAHWLEEIRKCPWGGGIYLAELLQANQLRSLVGERTQLLLLTEEEHLVSFCTYADRDDIDTALTPWAGFVYTDPAYRGHRYAGLLLERAVELARQDGMEGLYISTNHVGLYEKYGFSLYAHMTDIHGEDSLVYFRKA